VAYIVEVNILFLSSDNTKPCVDISYSFFKLFFFSRHASRSRMLNILNCGASAFACILWWRDKLNLPFFPLV